MGSLAGLGEKLLPDEPEKEPLKVTFEEGDLTVKWSSGQDSLRDAILYLLVKMVACIVAFNCFVVAANMGLFLISI